MKMCKHDCRALCDFCKHFDSKDVIETGEGFCRRDSRFKDPCMACSEFECRNYEEEKING